MSPSFFHLCCFLDSLVPSHIAAYSLLWEGCVRPGSIVWLMLPYAGNTRKDIGLCWEPAGVWNESSSSWILCSVARRMLRQLQSCIEFLDRSFCLCSALGSLLSRVSNPKCWATQRAAPSCWHPSNKNSSYLVFQNVIANKWVRKRLQKNISTSLSKCSEACVGREAAGEVPGTKLSF